MDMVEILCLRTNFEENFQEHVLTKNLIISV
jgi:hypothetical protein